MNVNSCKKNIYTLIIMLMFVLMFTSTSYGIDDIILSGRNFLEKGETIENTIDTNELSSTSNYIYRILYIIAIIVAVIVAMVLGIQFMVASADEKAKVKESLLPFVIGCFVVFGSFTIWKMVVNIGNKTEMEGTAEAEGSKVCENCGTILQGGSWGDRADISHIGFCPNCGSENFIYSSEE